MTNISYELVKELKEAGFEQLHTEGTYIGKTKHGAVTIVSDTTFYIPTLSELIEWCGRVWVGPCEKGWHAGFGGHPFSHLDERRPQGCGFTPEEAVARLGIAIHGRNKENTE